MENLYRFIYEHKLAALATRSSSGAPQSALVGIAVTSDLEIIFDTVRSSRKYPNLMGNSSCSLVIGWEGEITVQYEGEARELKGTEQDAYKKVYFDAWPDGPSRQSWPGIVYFAVKPRWIRYSDFNQAPPLIEEFTL